MAHRNPRSKHERQRPCRLYSAVARLRTTRRQQSLWLQDVYRRKGHPFSLPFFSGAEEERYQTPAPLRNGRIIHLSERSVCAPCHKVCQNTKKRPNFRESPECELRLYGVLGSSPPGIATHLTKIGHLADAPASNAAYKVNETGCVTPPIGFAPGSHLY